MAGGCRCPACSSQGISQTWWVLRANLTPPRSQEEKEAAPPATGAPALGSPSAGEWSCLPPCCPTAGGGSWHGFKSPRSWVGTRWVLVLPCLPSCSPACLPAPLPTQQLFCLPGSSLLWGSVAATHTSESGAYFYVGQARGQVTPDGSGPRERRRQSRAPAAREPSLQGWPTFWGCSAFWLQWLCPGVPAAALSAAPLHVGLGSLCKTLFAPSPAAALQKQHWGGPGAVCRGESCSRRG